MPFYHSEQFVEFKCGEYECHRYDFSIESHLFVVIFSPVDIDDAEYRCFRSDEVGFVIPSDCYDVKFDRFENFENENYFVPPKKGECARDIYFLDHLAEALVNIITLHHNVYHAKAYFAVAETMKLKRFYDRILHHSFAEVAYEVTTDLGERGNGYALKTRHFSSETNDRIRKKN